MNKKIKLFGICVVIANIIYLVWLTLNLISGLSLLLLVSELLFSSLGLLFLINHWSQDHYLSRYFPIDESLDVFITVVNEPIELFEPTLKSACSIKYSKKTVYVLDDGKRKSVEQLAKMYKAHYITRSDNKDYKAGNLNNALKHSSSNFILVLDADQVVKPMIANDVLGHFANDSLLAFITTRQSFSVPKNNFNHDVLFYSHMQTGKNSNNSSISTGSGVFYRRTAIERINGFQTWNIVEDLYTSYVLHINGFKTKYINTIYSRGTAPTDIPTIYKQRGTWATDTLRLFFKKNILFEKRLTIRQKLHYFESAWVYIVPAVALPIIFVLPSISLLINTPIIHNSDQYIFFRLPSLIGLIIFYFILSSFTFSTSQFWASLFPVYIKALFLSVQRKKPKYKVTNKNPGHNVITNLRLISVQLACIALGFVSEILRIFVYDHRLSSLALINLVWIVIMLFWFGPIIKCAFINPIKPNF